MDVDLDCSAYPPDPQWWAPWPSCIGGAIFLISAAIAAHIGDEDCRVP